MKKIFGLAFLLLAGCLGVWIGKTAEAATTYEKDCFVYELNKDGKSLTLVGTNYGKSAIDFPSKEGILSIEKTEKKGEETTYKPLYSSFYVPGSVNINGYDYPVTRIADYSLLGICTEEVVIGEGIQRIGANPGARNIKKDDNTAVSIPSTLDEATKDSVYQVPFSGWKSVKISSKNKKYSSKDNIVYTKNMKTLLNGQMAKGKVRLPKTVRTIEPYAFCYSEIESIVLNDKLKEIGTRAFQECHDLHYIEIPKSVSRLQKNTFYDTNLEKIVLGKGVKKVSVTAFAKSYYLDKVIVDKANKYIVNEGGLILSKNKRRLLCSGEARRDVVIPKSVTTISAGVFADNKEIDSIKIKGNVRIIPKNAFSRCSAVKIELPNTVTVIGEGSYLACENLKKIILPKSVKRIKKDAFVSCDLERLIIPKNVRLIEENALELTTQELIFKGITPPVLKKQKKVVVISDDECGEDSIYNYPEGKEPGIGDVWVPDKSRAKYKKAFKGKLQYNILAG